MTRLGDDVVGSFDHGLNSDVDTGVESLSGVSRPATRGVQLKAAETNLGTVFVGNADLTTNGSSGDGFPLAAGEGLFLPVDDLAKVYIAADEPNQRVYWLVV